LDDGDIFALFLHIMSENWTSVIVLAF